MDGSVTFVALVTYLSVTWSIFVICFSSGQRYKWLHTDRPYSSPKNHRKGLFSQWPESCLKAFLKRNVDCCPNIGYKEMNFQNGKSGHSSSNNWETFSRREWFRWMKFVVCRHQVSLELNERPMPDEDPTRPERQRSCSPNLKAQVSGHLTPPPLPIHGTRGAVRTFKQTLTSAVARALPTWRLPSATTGTRWASVKRWCSRRLRRVPKNLLWTFDRLEQIHLDVTPCCPVNNLCKSISFILRQEQNKTHNSENVRNIGMSTVLGGCRTFFQMKAASMTP